MRGDTGTYYLAINRNKRSIVLDLGGGEDRAVAHELSARADVTIQNFRPGGLVKFGLDYDSVRLRDPAAIYCSISGFGADKGARLPGYDLLAQAVSGLMSASAPGRTWRADPRLARRGNRSSARATARRRARATSAVSLTTRHRQDEE